MKICQKLYSFVLIGLSVFLFSHLAQARESDRSGSVGQQNPQEKRSYEIINAIEQGSIRKGTLKALTNNEIQTRYLVALDPAKIYFTKADIVLIQQEYPIVFDDIQAGKLNNLFKIYDLFQQRCREKNTYDLKVLALGLEKLGIYSGKVINVRYADWAESSVLREERWANLLAEDYLAAAAQDQRQDKVFDKVKARYQTELQTLAEQTPENSYQSAMNKLLSLYDERTQYFGLVDNEKFTVNFNRVGLGVELNIQDGLPTVLKAIEGTPAQGKLFPNDKLIAFSNDNENFTELAGLSLNSVIRMLKGEKDTKIYLKVLSDKNPGLVTNIVLTRKNVDPADQEVSVKKVSVCRKNKNFTLGVLLVPSFYLDFSAMKNNRESYKSAARDSWKLLGQLSEDNVDGVIIDLRDNGGGALYEASQFFSLFQSSGVVFYIKELNEKISSQEANPHLLVFKKPIIVLVNRQSAGSSELFAAAVQNHQRGLVVGESTFGMGIVSSVSSVSSGTLKMSVARLYDPKGQPINQVGVTPDISFPSAENKIPAAKDIEPPIEASLKTKKLKYSMESVKAKHLKRIEQAPVFSYMTASKKQLQQAETGAVMLDINQRLKIADEQRRYLENYAKPLVSNNEDIMQLLSSAELQEAGEILVDTIVH